MEIRALSIEGSFEITPRQFPDDRGVFLESFRGVHFADVPPSQAKYITALSGSFIDFVIDIRVGSPTFGRWESALLDTVDRRALIDAGRRAGAAPPV